MYVEAVHDLLRSKRGWDAVNHDFGSASSRFIHLQTHALNGGIIKQFLRLRSVCSFNKNSTFADLLYCSDLNKVVIRSNPLYDLLSCLFRGIFWFTFLVRLRIEDCYHDQRPRSALHN